MDASTTESIKDVDIYSIKSTNSMSTRVSENSYMEKISTAELSDSRDTPGPRKRSRTSSGSIISPRATSHPFTISRSPDVKQRKAKIVSDAASLISPTKTSNPSPDLAHTPNSPSRNHLPALLSRGASVVRGSSHTRPTQEMRSHTLPSFKDNLITSYFTPSPRNTQGSSHPQTLPSTNLVQHIAKPSESKALKTETASNSMSKRLLPPFGADESPQSREKRKKLKLKKERRLEREFIYVDDRLIIDLISSDESEHDEYKEEVTVIEDSESEISTDSILELFDEYDPYFDTLETPKRKPITVVSENPTLSSTPTFAQSNISSSELVKWHHFYELLLDKNTHKPYMSKRARAFMRHLGDWDEFMKFDNKIIHVDFSEEEVQQFRRYQLVRGRTKEDCLRFQQDYPDLILDYDIPKFIHISLPRPDCVKASLPHLLVRQHRRAELGFKTPLSDRELRKLCNLKPRSTFNHASGDVIDFKFSPINNQFALCCNTLTNDYNRPGNLLLGDAMTEFVTTLDGHSDRLLGVERYYTVSDIRFSNDGQYLYSGSYDNTVKIWDTKGEMLSSLTGHGRITALSTTSCSDRVIAVASDDGDIYLYDVMDPAKPGRTVLKGQNERLCGSFLVPGQGWYIHWMLAGYEAKDGPSIGALHIYDVPTGTMLQRVVPASNAQASAYFHPGVNHFAVGAVGHFNTAGPNAKSVVRIFDARTQRATLEIGIDSPQKDINKVTLSPCGFRVTSSGTDGQTFVWDLRTVRRTTEPMPLHILAHGPTKMVHPVDGQLEDWDTGVSVTDWLPQSDYLMTGGSDGFLKLWDTRLGQPFVRDIAEFDSAVSSADFNYDRDMLGVGESSGRVTFLHRHGQIGGEELKEFQLHQAVVEGADNEGILAARELLESGKVRIVDDHGLRSVFAV